MAMNHHLDLREILELHVEGKLLKSVNLIDSDGRYCGVGATREATPIVSYSLNRIPSRTAASSRDYSNRYHGNLIERHCDEVRDADEGHDDDDDEGHDDGVDSDTFDGGPNFRIGTFDAGLEYMGSSDDDGSDRVYSDRVDSDEVDSDEVDIDELYSDEVSIDKVDSDVKEEEGEEEEEEEEVEEEVLTREDEPTQDTGYSMDNVEHRGTYEQAADVSCDLEKIVFIKFITIITFVCILIYEFSNYINIL